MPEVPYDELRWEVVLSAAGQFAEQPAGHGRVLSGVAVDFPTAPGGPDVIGPTPTPDAAGPTPTPDTAGPTPDAAVLAPDLVVLARGAVRGERGRFGAAGVEAVLEVARPDLAEAGRAYASSGVPLYVVVDPAAAVCTVHTAPSPEGVYREAERVPFGNDLFLSLGGRTVVLRTDPFPTPSPTPGADRGVGRGIVDG
ncbi:Uma2 family endonuclease [Kitasatospora sp. NPDC097691]|uniref:Uma2 family endonuclease n=1 Tax=Kitasatospora sp. NPDC097691 TaxID=3157231 RepID=UPI00333408C9